MPKRETTIREKAAVIYGLITGVRDLSTFYMIAKGDARKIYNPDSLKSAGSKLYKSEAIQTYLTQAREIAARFVQEQTKGETGTEKGKAGEAFTLQNVNFTNPAEFIEYLNKQANNLTEERDKREYLKMLSDLLRFKEGNSAQNNEVQRFYTPLSCQNCALYKQAAKDQSE